MPEALFDISSGSAVISPCGEYRYVLTRHVGSGRRGRANFVMVNPSTADAIKPDPTLTRCVNFARDWGYGDLVLTNLFALRSSKPKVLKSHRDPIGPDNDRHVVEQAKASDLIVVAWGPNGALFDRDKTVVAMLLEIDVVHVLQMTASGHPQHPLFVPANVVPKVWTPAA